MSLPPGRYVGQDEYQFHCFDCPPWKEAKGYFNTAKGVGECKRCKRIYFWKDFGGEPNSLARMLEPTRAPKRWANSDDLCSVYDDSRAWEYLVQRKVPERHWIHLSYLPSTNELYLPIYSIDGGPPSFTRRTVGEKGWRVIGGLSNDDYIFYVDDVQILETRPILLVEGPFDVLTPDWDGRVFPMALLGTNLSEQKLAWLTLLGNHVYIWLDPDEAGRIAARKILKQLMCHGVNADRICYDKEPGDCTPQEAHEVLRRVLGHR